MMEVFSEEWLRDCGFPAQAARIVAQAFVSYPPEPGLDELERAKQVIAMTVGWNLVEDSKCSVPDPAVREFFEGLAVEVHRVGWDWWLVWCDSDPTVKVRGHGVVGDVPELVDTWRP